jgi:anti-anti-sigma regulatory factor
MSDLAVRAGAPAGGSRLWVQWTLSKRARSTVVSFAGELDLANGDFLVDTLRAVIDGGTPRLIVDLTAVVLRDAAGASAIHDVRRHAAARRVGFDLVCADSVQRQALDPTGADELDEAERRSAPASAG